MGGQAELSGPDLKQGVSEDELPDGGMLVGHADGESVLLARRGQEVFAIGATCTHYGGPLGEGLFIGNEVRCPWHHACFSLKTGAAVRAPALNALPCFEVERRDGRLVVLGKREAVPNRLGGNAPGGAAGAAATPRTRIVIVGAGAAGEAAAEMLRREGFEGQLVLLGRDPDVPVDRPNLSKDYLAGNAPEEWVPLRPREFYAENQIELRRERRVIKLDAQARKIELESGETLEWDALLLATGAEPVRLGVPGAERVLYLRTFTDCRTLIARATSARRAVVIGASFIGLEVAASLRTRGLEVDVVAPESRPLERVMGPELGDFIRGLHEAHGVRFHLGDGVTAIEQAHVVLKSGGKLEADLVVAGIGVRPSVEIAERGGLVVDRGIVVNDELQTSAEAVFAAGDAARFPDVRSGQKIRVEHWVVAQRMGQVAAQNLLGRHVRFDSVPFFWSQHYDVPINYVGHAESWDRIDVSGKVADRDCALAYRKAGRTLAIASIYRDHVSLEAEAAMERGDEAALLELVPPAAQ